MDQRKLLIAEDEPMLRSQLTDLVQGWGYEVTAACDGLEAWEVLQGRGAPSLAVLDWNMPGLQGDEVCRRARAELADKPLHIILLTALKISRKDVVDGLNSGADDYLAKPFHAAELRARLRVGERIVTLQTELCARVAELETALGQIRQLQGLLPICSYCKKIRDDQNYWHQVEHYIADHSNTRFTHGICPTCYEQARAEIEGAAGASKCGSR